jgi:hypothetical protein
VKDSRKIAERLVALLPDRAALAGRNAATLLAPGETAKLGRSTMVFVLIMAVRIGMQVVAQRVHPPTSPPAATTAVPAVIPNNVQQ